MRDVSSNPVLWPPRTCVAAFIARALAELRCPAPSGRVLAVALQTHVGVGDDNPWSLPVTADRERIGVLATDADRFLRTLLDECSRHVGFRHVPFDSVVFRDFAGLLADARAGGCVVGVGFNPERLGWASGVHRHVARVEPGRHPEEVLLFDDSLGAATGESCEWATLEAATFEIDDGFWIIGPRSALSFDLAPPLV